MTSSGPPSLLWIDDEVESDDPIIQLLELEGFRVECAATGRCGMAKIGASSWDAILLDLHLPDIAGLMVLRSIRGAGVNCVLVVISGWYLDGEHERASLELGADVFIRKPVIFDDLICALRHAIEGHTDTGWRRSKHTSRPTTAQLLAFHDQTGADDHDAIEEVSSQLLDVVVRRLARRFPHAPNDLRIDATEDALLEYLARPERFDPSRMVPLDGYLFCAACRNLINYLDSERRRKARERQYVEQAVPKTFPSSVSSSEIRTEQLIAATSPNSAERGAMKLWLNGERSTAAFAKALGFVNLSAAQQRAQVKRFKDRVIKRLTRRFGPRHTAR